MSDTLAFSEEAGIIGNEQDWKEPRDVRNAIDHEYLEDAKAFAVLIAEMLNLVEPLLQMHSRAEQYCRVKLGVV